MMVFLTNWYYCRNLNFGLVATTGTAQIWDDFLGTDIDDKLAGNLSLGKTFYFVKTIGTTAMGDCRSILICATSLGDCLAISIRYSISSFSSS